MPEGLPEPLLRPFVETSPGVAGLGPGGEPPDQGRTSQMPSAPSRSLGLKLAL